MTIAEQITLINLGITILGGATALGAHLMAVRDLQARIKKAEERVDALHDHGGEHGRHTRYMIDMVTDRLGKMEQQQAVNSVTLQAITTDVRIISEWVCEQKERQR